MPINKDELAGKTVEEVIAIAVDLDAKLTDAQKGAPAAPAAPAPAAAPAPEATDKDFSDKVNKIVSEQTKTLSEQVKTLSETNKILAEKDRLNNVDAKLSELADKGIPKVVIDMARTICAADKGTNTITLSEKDEKGTVKDVTLSFTDAILKLAASVPNVQLGDQGDGSPAPATADKDLDAIRKYAEEKKVSFRAAMETLLKEGKIKAKEYFHTEG